MIRLRLTIITALGCLAPSARLPSFPSGSYATHHQGFAFSKRPSSCRRGSARSSHESICCHRDRSSRHQSICQDHHTCPKNCSNCRALNFLDVSVSLTDRAITHRSHSRLALSRDRAMTHQSHSPFLLSHRLPEVAPIALAIHQHRVSRNFLSLARRCFAALEARVNTLFNGPDCGCCSTFTWLRKLLSTTAGSTPSSSPSVDEPRFACASSRPCTQYGWGYHSNSNLHQTFHLSRSRKRPRCAVVRATIRFQFHVRTYVLTWPNNDD